MEEKLKSISPLIFLEIAEGSKHFKDGKWVRVMVASPKYGNHILGDVAIFNNGDLPQMREKWTFKKFREDTIINKLKEKFKRVEG